MAASVPIKEDQALDDVLNDLRLRNERDYIIFLIGYRTGYRTQDIVDLRVGDIRKILEECKFDIKEKKKFRNYETKKANGRKGYNSSPKPRVLKFERDEEFYDILKSYIKGKRAYEYAFKSQKGGHIGVDSYAKILKKVGIENKCQHLGAHTPRRTYAYFIWLLNGKDIIAAKEALGHTDIKTTIQYLGLEDEYASNVSKCIGSRIKR